jgi:hypothetical protein
MTITAPSPEGTQVLFPEARQRRRQRYWRAGIAVVLVVGLGVGLTLALAPTTPAHRTRVKEVAPRRRAGAPAPVGITPRQPGPLALSANGGLFVADDARDQILARQPDGRFTVVAGTGKAGFSGDGGPATMARLDGPQGMAVAPNGTLYFADAGNNRIRAILPNGTITTVAGNGSAATGPAGTPVVTGSADTTGLGETYAVALGPDGTLYIAAGDAVLQLTAGGTLTDLFDPENDAGFAPAEPQNAQCEPAAVAVDGAGDLYIACSDPYVLVERAPDGELTPLGADRPHDTDAALIAGPGGSVLAVEGFGVTRYSAAGPQEITNFLTTRLPGGQDFEPQGIAVGSDGTLYLSQDGSSGIGPPLIVSRSPDGRVTTLWPAAAPK